MNESCDGCRFWYPFDKTPDEEQMGICKRYPPVFVGANEDKASPDYGVMDWSQPHTEAGDRCGEFRPL